MKKFNINDFIKVKLTDRGRDIYYHRFDDLFPMGFVLSPLLEPSYPEVDEDGYSEFQLWDFMWIYGPYMYNGADNVIEKNEIFFEDGVLMDL